VNERPTCCAGMPYWSAAKKACDVDQYGALPMDGSKEDDQADCTGKPYWGVAKKGCSIDQYGAPPMDESKDSQAGAPATAAVAQGPAAPVVVPARAPTAATASKGPAVPRQESLLLEFLNKDLHSSSPPEHALRRKATIDDGSIAGGAHGCEGACCGVAWHLTGGGGDQP
jgi:hypothetical protein